MDGKLGIVYVIALKSKEQSQAGWKVSTWFIGLGALALVTLAAYLAVSVSGSAAALTQAEALTLGARTASPTTHSESAFLAANPEMGVARRFTLESNSAWLAANPELNIAHRYAAGAESRTYPLLGGR
jgi:hypothetical protein